MDVEWARMVTSPACVALAAAVRETGGADPLVEGQRLRDAGHDPTLVAAAMTQAELRRDAVGRLGPIAAGMVFTRAGLEQATRVEVAALHARRFRSAGVDRVADLTAGIGTDAIAMAALGIAVMAIEIDEATAMIADHNLARFGDAVVVHADAMDIARGIDVDGVYADPARRSSRGRRHSPADYSPPLDAVLGLRDTYDAVGVKVGPGIAHDAVPADVEAEWISVRGDVVECGIWCGPLAEEPGRRARVIVGDAHDAVRSYVVRDTGAAATVGDVGAYLLEPDGAVIRAGLVGEVAAETDGRLIDATIAYVTTDTAPTTNVARAYRVRDVLPFKEAALASYLRQRDVGRLTIKKRGMDLDPATLRKRLKPRGDEEATVIVTRAAGARVAIVADPLGTPSVPASD